MDRIQTRLTEFLRQYGEEGLLTALDNYANAHQKYICRTKTSISKINIYDIYYIEIRKHNMQVHTDQDIYSKYGSLSQELKQLSKYGFIKCSQNCIVSLDKIRRIAHDEIILINDAKLHISRNYITSMLMAYSQHKNAH